MLIKSIYKAIKILLRRNTTNKGNDGNKGDNACEYLSQVLHDCLLENGIIVENIITFIRLFVKKQDGIMRKIPKPAT